MILRRHRFRAFYNPLMHVLSYLALASFSAKSAAALLGAVQGLNFYLVFRISQILFSRNQQGISLPSWLSAARVQGITELHPSRNLGATYGDNMVSILVLAGLLLVMRRLQTGRIAGKKAIAVFAAAGFLVGAAFGLKFTSAIYLLGLLLALPLSLLKPRHCGRITVALACGSAIGFLATYGCWGINLYRSYQNPFFPYLNKIFHSPYFEISNFFDKRFLPGSWQQTLFYPFFFAQRNQLVSEIEFRDVRLALCYTAIVLLSVVGVIRFTRGRPSGGRCSSPG